MKFHALDIDDDPDIQDGVRDRLESLGHTCDCVGSQGEAREHLRSDGYAYVLLDLEIPVSIHRHCDCCVPAPLLNNFRVDSFQEHKRCGRVPEIVEVD